MRLPHGLPGSLTVIVRPVSLRGRDHTPCSSDSVTNVFATCVEFPLSGRLWNKLPVSNKYTDESLIQVVFNLARNLREI